jgi:hypothetical protein
MNKKLIALVAGAVLVVLAAGVAYVALADGDGDDRRSAALVTRSYTAGFIGIELDGANVGTVRSVAGCDVAAPAATVNTVDGVQKQAGAPQYAPCTIRFSSGMKPAFYQWVVDALAGKSLPRSVAIIVFDSSYKAINRLQLAEASVTRFALPALRAGSDEQVVFELTIAASSVKRAAPSGTMSSGTTPKAMLASNFKLSSLGLDKDLSYATAVDSWAFEIPRAQSGDLKVSSGPPQLGDLTVTVNAPGGAEFDAWLDGLILGKPTEKPLTLSLMDATLKAPLVDVVFPATGLVGADLLGSAESSSSPTKRSFSMYVEGAAIKFNIAS